MPKREVQEEKNLHFLQCIVILFIIKRDNGQSHTQTREKKHRFIIKTEHEIIKLLNEKGIETQKFPFLRRKTFNPYRFFSLRNHLLWQEFSFSFNKKHMLPGGISFWHGFPRTFFSPAFDEQLLNMKGDTSPHKSLKHSSSSIKCNDFPFWRFLSHFQETIDVRGHEKYWSEIRLKLYVLRICEFKDFKYFFNISSHLVAWQNSLKKFMNHPEKRRRRMKGKWWKKP